MASIKQLFLIDIVHKTTNTKIPRENVLYACIKENILDVIPRLELKMNDKGYFTEGLSIVDGDVITITMAPNEEAIAISLDFVISDYVIEPKQEGKTSVITFTAMITSNKILTPYTQKMYSGTARDVLMTLATNAGFTPNTSISTQTSDRMIWFQNGNTLKFVNEVLTRSYIPNDVSFFYVDHKKQAIHATYKTAWGKLKRFDAKYSIPDTQKMSFDAEDTGIMYYSGFDVSSMNGEIKRRYGYGEQIYSYDGKGGDTVETFVDQNKMAELKNVDFGYVGKYSNMRKYGWVGNNPNVYKDYNLAIAQNEVMKMNMYENTISLNINPLTDVNLMDKINLQFPSFVESGDGLNEVMSGDYLVAGIVHTVSVGGTYEKRILLIRRGLNKSKERQYTDVE